MGPGNEGSIPSYSIIFMEYKKIVYVKGKKYWVDIANARMVNIFNKKDYRKLDQEAVEYFKNLIGIRNRKYII